jgi:hypothetical protein
MVLFTVGKRTKAVLRLAVLGLTTTTLAGVPAGYKGTPFHDDVVKTYPQKIPGQLQFEYYDIGGDNVAYHGCNALNGGVNDGAALNGPSQQNCPDQTTQYICQFRSHEPVAISYTKTCCDQSEYNKVPQILKQMYVGWTNPGEWLNYTVHVDTAGLYSLNFMYTSNAGAKVSLAVNNSVVADNINILTTYDAKDPTGWRQWHHWNKLTGIAQLSLDTGTQLVTFKIITNGNMNLDYLDFVRKGAVGAAPGAPGGIARAARLRLTAPRQAGSRGAEVLFTLAQPGATELALFDCAGKRIATVLQDRLCAGDHSILIGTSGLARGVYMVRLSQGASATVRMMSVAGK